MGYMRVWDSWESRIQGKFTPLLLTGETISVPGAFSMILTLLSMTFKTLPCIFGGSWAGDSIMNLSQWQNTSKDLGPDHFLTSHMATEFANSLIEAGPGQHRIPIGFHHQTSTRHMSTCFSPSLVPDNRRLLLGKGQECIKKILRYKYTGKSQSCK